MVTASRPVDLDLERAPLFELLKQEPFRFQFFQAVRLLQRIVPDRSKVGTFVHPSEEVIRFSARQSLAFPASEVHAIEFRKDRPAGMAVNFMGLTGPQGALPLCYTE